MVGNVPPPTEGSSTGSSSENMSDNEEVYYGDDYKAGTAAPTIKCKDSGGSSSSGASKHRGEFCLSTRRLSGLLFVFYHSSQLITCFPLAFLWG